MNFIHGKWNEEVFFLQKIRKMQQSIISVFFHKSQKQFTGLVLLTKCKSDCVTNTFNPNLHLNFNC